jgi:hypothetical protein
MTPEVLEHKQAQFLALAARAFEQMFGSDGQNGLVTFAEREERACEATDGLARWRMAEHVAQDRTGAGGVPLHCPICQGPVQETSDRPPESQVREYVNDNAERMDYARYRREGLPVTSTRVESLIKQFNQRVKGTEKFWGEGGAEAILQGRAAYLSEDGRAEAFYAHRPRGRAVGQNRLRLSA